MIASTAGDDLALLRAALGRLDLWSRHVVRRPLRPYQREPAEAILRSVREGAGETITVMMSRQAGKNELSAQIESFLLARSASRPAQIVKAAPTFKPQVINSIARLTAALENPITRGRWTTEHGYIVRVGLARILFFSAAPEANVVGATASLLLEIDEAQDVDPAKHDKAFAPMAASTNATRVYYGTAWDSTTLLHRQIQANLEAEKRDGRRRHFAYPWWIVAEHNPAYGRFAEAERNRLGADHPLFKTQYALETIDAEAGFFTPMLRAQLVGTHARREEAQPDATYVAALDVAGGAELPTDRVAHDVSRDDTTGERGAEHGRERDSTVLLIGRVDWDSLAPADGGPAEPRVLVERAYQWTGIALRAQGPRLLDLLRNVWHVQRLAVDASGLGVGLAEYLLAALGEHAVESVTFSAPVKSLLAYNLLGAVAAGRIKWYAHGDADAEAAEFWREVAACRYQVRPNQQMTFFVPDGHGHDDYVSALALLAHVGRGSRQPAISSILPAPPLYRERFEREQLGRPRDEGRF